MFKYKPLKNQILEERKKTARLSAEIMKKSADIDYIAMMCDIELEESEDKDE